MLSYKKFKEEIRAYMGQQLGSRYEVNIGKVRKANVGLLDCMTILGKEKGGKHISPNIYLKPFYQKYKDGMGMQEIKEAVVSQYREGAESAEVFMETMPDIGDYENCKGRLYFKLVGTERNHVLLKEVPHREVMDLSIIPYILLNESEDGTSSVMVSNAMAESWGVPADTILGQAFDNMPKIMPAKASTMKSLAETILGIAADNKDDADMADMVGTASGMAAASGMVSGAGRFPNPFILTNKKGINGFSTVLYPGVLKDAADMVGKNLFILPSSIHESLLVADDGSVGIPDLCKMVKEVNQTYVAEDEVVSNSVYFYNREEGKLGIAGEEALCVKL